jgi:hypothetical protein
MSEFDNTNRGVLFRNENKTEDYHGDYTGTINIDGTEYFLDAYLKTSKAGKKFFSLKRGKAKQGQREQPRQESRQAQKAEPPPYDDDFPF